MYFRRYGKMNNLTTRPQDSIKTSQNQIANTYKVFAEELKESASVLDFGAGKYNEKLAQYAADNNINLSLYDPYNEAIAIKPEGIFDTVINNNVLNVIECPDIYASVVRELYSTAERKLIIKVYTGNRSGIGAATKIGTFQHNKTAKQHKAIIEGILKGIEIKTKGDFLIISK